MDVVCWFLNVPAACYSISETDLLRKLYVLPHWDRSSRPNFLSHTITVCWHRANQSQCRPYNARRLTSQQNATVSQRRICWENGTCYHTETEVADQTFYLTQSHYADTGPTSPSADPIRLGAWRPSNMLQYLRDGSAQTTARAATLRQKQQDQTFYLAQSQYTDTRPTSPSAHPKTPGAWQGSHWSSNFEVTGMTRPGNRPTAKTGIEPRPAALEADVLTTRPTRPSEIR